MPQALVAQSSCVLVSCINVVHALFAEIQSPEEEELYVDIVKPHGQFKCAMITDIFCGMKAVGIYNVAR